MIVYSLDFGLDLEATGGRCGTAADPFPLQFGLCRGELKDDGRLVAQQLWSFTRLRSREKLIFRIFDISPEGYGEIVGVPQMSRATFRTLAGEPAAAPWTPSTENFSYRAASDEKCLSFATISRNVYPCYLKVDEHDEPVLYQLNDVAQPENFLMSAMVALRAVTAVRGGECFFDSDPEMVIGPYDGGGAHAGLEEAFPSGQLPVTVAAIR